MNYSTKKVYVVDDDFGVSKGLYRLLRAAGYDPMAFLSAQEFLEYYKPDTKGCLLLDVSMPGISGLELQRWLMQLHSNLPVIFLTGQGDIPSTVQAMKDGAVDFLVKPVNEQDLLRAIEEALQRESESRAAHAEAGELRARLATLTPREREVLEHLVSGRLNKQVAAELGTVEKTIKVHRARVFEKMGVQSMAELARLAERAGIGRPPPPASATTTPPL